MRICYLFLLLRFQHITCSTLPACTFESCPVCFSDAVNVTKNLDVYSYGALLSVPFRIGRCLDYWDSQAIVAQIVGIIVKERLGYNVEYIHFDADMAGFYGLHNCQSWESSDCPKVVRSEQEALLAYNASGKTYPDTAPDLMFVPEIGAGEIFSSEWNAHTDIVFLAAEARVFAPTGYILQNYFFIYPEIAEQAWTQDRIALDTYKTFAIPQAGRYFDTVQHLLDTGLIEHEVPGCDFSSHDAYASYAKNLFEWGWTCVDDGWWLTPACSALGANWKQECIPLLDDSWTYPKPEIFEFIPTLGLRLARVTLGYDLFWELVYYKSVNAPFLWWFYDSQFTALKPVKVNMPQAYELAANLQLATNMGWLPVLDSDEQLAYLLANLRISSIEMDKLMDASAAAQALDYWSGHETGPQLYQKLACDFLREHRSIWEQAWLLDPRSCSLGHFYNKNVSLCQPCPSGSYSLRDILDGIPRCLPCTPGHFCLEKSAKPEKCPIGYFSASPGAGTCSPCTKGKYQNQAGQTSCVDCKERTTTLPDSNRIRESDCACDLTSYGVGQDCLPCPGNSATAFLAATSISDCLCAADTYMSDTFACMACPDGSRTEGNGRTNLTSCLCDKGMFISYGASACTSCPDGFTCPVGSNAYNFADRLPSGAEQSFPLLEKGYWTYASKPLEVYMCTSIVSGRCSGGTPESCAGGHKGFLCSECEMGQMSSEEQCVECSFLQKLGPILVLVILLLVSIGIYYFGNDPHRTKPTSRLLLGVIIGMLITNGQVIGTFNQLNVPWPDSVKGFMALSAVLLFDPDNVSAECMLGFDPALLYASRFALPFLIVAQFACLYSLSKVCAIAKASFVLSLDKILNSMGVIFQIAFIALCGFVAVPFQCYSHPNGLKSISTYPAIICNTKEQNPLIIMSILTLLVFVIPYLAVTLWAARRVVANQAGDKNLIIRFRFLFYRFRPDVWWWGIAFTTRQTFLAFAPIVEPDDPAMQIFYIVLVLATYSCLVCYFFPWKSPGLNIFDAFSAVVLMLVVVGVSSFMPESRWQVRHVEITRVLLGLLFTCGGLAVCSVIAIMAFSRSTGRMKDVNQLSSNLQRFGEFLSTLQEQDVREILFTMNFYDLRTLMASMSVWQASVGSQFQIACNLPSRIYDVTEKGSIQKSGAKVEMSRSTSNSGESSSANRNSFPSLDSEYAYESSPKQPIVLESKEVATTRDASTATENEDRPKKLVYFPTLILL